MPNVCEEGALDCHLRKYAFPSGKHGNTLPPFEPTTHMSGDYRAFGAVSTHAQLDCLGGGTSEGCPPLEK